MFSFVAWALQNLGFLSFGLFLVYVASLLGLLRCFGFGLRTLRCVYELPV